MRPVSSFILSGALVFCTIFSAVAQEDASGVVKSRIERMKSMADDMKSIAQMLRGETAYNGKSAQILGEAIAKGGGKMLTDLFPKGSLMPPSEASPKTWQMWLDFEKSAAQLQTNAENFAKTAQKVRSETESALQNDPGIRGSFGGTGADLLPPTGAQIEVLRAAYTNMGKSCKSCHEQFRIKKQK